MKLRTIGYALIVGAAVVALSIGSATTSEAKRHHKKKVSPPPPQPQICLAEYAPVCGSLRGHKFTYANACSAWKDGASIVSWKACPVKAAKHHRKGKKKSKKKAKM